ncbi:DUF6531 domain-containing protein [Streptomyces sp. MAR4 CNX-425]|uniref:DUF6531 domain-containing protein n=1 Tax=Streptomyces sp. MAR4 CNX-425 TaxID=3406343 RepID=UPI003B5016A8
MVGEGGRLGQGQLGHHRQRLQGDRRRPGHRRPHHRRPPGLGRPRRRPGGAGRHPLQVHERPSLPLGRRLRRPGLHPRHEGPHHPRRPRQGPQRRPGSRQGRYEGHGTRPPRRSSQGRHGDAQARLPDRPRRRRHRRNGDGPNRCRSPGAAPLVLHRAHVSSFRSGRCFGGSWASTLDQRLEIDEDSVTFFTDDGWLCATRAGARCAGSSSGRSPVAVEMERAARRGHPRGASGSRAHLAFQSAPGVRRLPAVRRSGGGTSAAVDHRPERAADRLRATPERHPGRGAAQRWISDRDRRDRRQGDEASSPQRARAAGADAVRL